MATKQLHYDLDVDHLTVDPELLACVSASLARYFLALPLAREENQVSVLMAYPDNQSAVAFLGKRLGAEILPLGGEEAHIRRAIDRVYAASSAANGVFVSQVAWHGAAQTASAQMARRIGHLLKLPVKHVEPLTDAAEDSLLIRTAMPTAELPALLAQRSGPLLLVGEKAKLPRRILVVLRGYASDQRVLDMLIPLARGNAVSITAIVLTTPQPTDMARLLCQEGAAKQHMDAYLHRLQEEGIAARLLLRLGESLTQISDELAHSPYDLLVVAAEGQGIFVTQLLAALERRQVLSASSILIVKPPTRDREAQHLTIQTTNR